MPFKPMALEIPANFIQAWGMHDSFQACAAAFIQDSWRVRSNLTLAMGYVMTSSSLPSLLPKTDCD
jgi:hypothetical protein